VDLSESDDIARLWSDEDQGYRLCVLNNTLIWYEAGFVGLALSAVFMSVLGVFHMPVSRVSNKKLTDMTKSKSYTHHFIEMQRYTTLRYDTYHGISFTIRYVSRYSLLINQSD
jgi:hypothetical protein